MSEFLRVTVVLIHEDTNEPNRTMRVPMAEDTTVLRLAKEVLHRYQQQQLPYQPNVKHVGVIKVYVENGNAELFVHDIVKHAVNITEEKICMVLRQKTPAVPAASVPQPAAAPATVAVQLPPAVAAVKEQSSNVVSPTKRKSVASVATSPPSAFKHISKSQPMPAQVPVQSPPTGQPTRRTPATQPRAVECREDSPPLTRRRTESGDGSGTPEAARVQDIDRMSPTTRRAFLKKKQEESSIGWGVDAHKSFASNYVSDPEKMARDLRRLKRAQNQAGASKDDAMDCDNSSSSQLAAAEAEKPKPKAKSALAEQPVNVSAARVLFTPAEPAVKKPDGWGPLASKYFDPETYLDDPSKAKLSSFAMANTGPIRARRS